MKDSKYGYVFYIATTICFLFILAYIVTDSPVISPPAEYVYWEEEISSEQESLPETSSLASSEVISSKKENKPISKSANVRVNTSKTSSKTATKHYISSTQSSSMPVSSKEEILETSKEEIPQPQRETSSKAEKPPVDNTSIVNINTASKEQLMSLDGIGDVISQRIIDFRKNIGGFNSIEEIMNVKGIGEKTFEAIKNRLTV